MEFSVRLLPLPLKLENIIRFFLYFQPFYFQTKNLNVSYTITVCDKIDVNGIYLNAPIDISRCTIKILLVDEIQNNAHVTISIKTPTNNLSLNNKGHRMKIWIYASDKKLKSKLNCTHQKWIFISVIVLHSFSLFFVFCLFINS